MHSSQNLNTMLCKHTALHPTIWLVLKTNITPGGYTVVLKSEGIVKKHQADVLGVYRMVDSYNDRPVYKQDGGENYIYYRYWNIQKYFLCLQCIGISVQQAIPGLWGQLWVTNMAGSGTQQKVPAVGGIRRFLCWSNSWKQSPDGFLTWSLAGNTGRLSEQWTTWTATHGTQMMAASGLNISEVVNLYWWSIWHLETFQMLRKSMNSSET